MVLFFDMDGTKNALAPIEFIVGVAGGIVLFLVGLSAVFLVFGNSGGSFLTIGDREVCVVASSSAVQTRSSHVAGLAPAVRSFPEQLNICQSDPSTWQHTLAFLSVAPPFLYSIGFLFFTWRLIRTTRRRGFFVPGTALGIGRLGLYVLFGELAVAVVHSTASAPLLHTMAATTGGALDIWLRFFHLSWAALFAGFGLLTIGRVMAQTVPMQAELDATV
jgi:hypothetical protein